jgi:hypothetical protein
MAEKKITAVMIIEVAGRPPEYLENSLKLHLDKLNHIKDVKVISSKMAEPRLVETEKEIYTCFGEVEVEVIGFSKIMDLVFEFMPSSIEIINPSEIEFNCQEATMFVNDMAGRLHKYDEIAKIARMQIQNLTQQLQSRQEAQKQVSSLVQPLKVTFGNPDEQVQEKKTKKKKSKK